LPWQCTGLGKGLERGLGKGTTAATELQKACLVTQLRQARLYRLHHATGKQLAQLGRGDEVAGLAELGLASAVIAQPGCIETTLHVLRERQRSVRRDLLAQVAEQAVGVGPLIGSGGGEWVLHACNE
jgi:hypothetical protein